MTNDSTPLVPASLPLPGGLPALLAAAGETIAWRFVEFFTATLRNPNTVRPMPVPSAAFWPGARVGDSRTSGPSRWS
jgi:hypothetical protein